MTDKDVRAAIESLRTGELDAVLWGYLQLKRVGADGAADLLAVVSDENANTLTRAWGLAALAEIAKDVVTIKPLLEPPIRQLLGSPKPTLRYAAIEAVRTLSDDTWVPMLADLLSDHTPVPGAWFEEDDTISKATALALESIGTPDALAVLARWRVADSKSGCDLQQP